MRRLSNRLVRGGALDVVATAAPGIKDILVLGKVKQLERARRGRPDRARRARGRPRHHLPASARGLLDAVRSGPINTQAARRAGAAHRPGAVPGRARDAARGDAGQRAGRHRLQPRGPRWASAWARGRERALSRASPGSTPTRSPRPTRPASPLAPGEAAALARRGRVPRRPRARCSASRSARLADRLPLPQIHLPFLFTADLGPDRRRRCSPTLRCSSIARPRARRDPSMTARPPSSSPAERRIVRVLRLGRRRQDDHRGGRSRCEAARQGRRAVRRHDRPGQAPRRRPRARGAHRTRPAADRRRRGRASCGR